MISEKKSITRDKVFKPLSLPLLLIFLLVLPTKMVEASVSDKKIALVFSDLDGTLIHYPNSVSRGNEALLELPQTSTGMKGVISPKTFLLAQEIRKRGMKLVLISGMRTTTLFQRIPYLPRADAYCSESGGRIFYPIQPMAGSSAVFIPKRYDGCTVIDLEHFCLQEDMVWRQRMEQYTGEFDLKEPIINVASHVSAGAEKRAGILWDFARKLVDKGYVVDAKGYSASFRLNKRHQTLTSDDPFQGIFEGESLSETDLATSVNLNCIDIYPCISGKKNCCQYLGERFFPNLPKSKVLSAHSVCLCDDDNDIEMATACSHAYIPSIASLTMAETIKQKSNHFTITYDAEKGVNGTRSSELALSLILERQ